MTVYPEMNNKIVELLRMGGTPVEFYAAQRIEELELKNKELIDSVLEIIDKERRYFESHYTCNEMFTYRDYIRHFASVQRAVEALKGEQG